MGKEGEKKAINVLTTFFIFDKSGAKTFLKWIVNQYLKGTRQHDPFTYKQWVVEQLVRQPLRCNKIVS